MCRPVQCLKDDAGEVLRRLPVICLEDGLLHPSFAAIVWLMAAEVGGEIDHCKEEDMRSAAALSPSTLTVQHSCWKRLNRFGLGSMAVVALVATVPPMRQRFPAPGILFAVPFLSLYAVQHPSCHSSTQVRETERWPVLKMGTSPPLHVQAKGFCLGPLHVSLVLQWIFQVSYHIIF